MPANTTDIEKRLWSAADEFRANSKLKSSEYSIPVLGLIFLKYADQKFQKAEEELKAQLGLRKIIWLPGIKGKDITDAHVDFYARFVTPGVVIANLDTDPESYDHNVTLAHLEGHRVDRRQVTEALGDRAELDVVASRQRARQIAALCGFRAQDQVKISTAVSELARNVFEYAGTGNKTGICSNKEQTCF